MHHLPDGNANVNDPAVRRVIQDFGGAEALNSCETLETAIEKMTEFVKQWHGLPPVVHKVWSGRVEVSYSVPTNGKGAITFTLSDVLDEQADQDAIDERVIALTDMMRTTYTNLVSRRGGFGVAATQSTERTNDPLPHDGGIPVTMLVHGFDKGKHLFKVKGGEFQTFGVPIYHEALDAAGIDHASMAIGEHPIKGFMWIHYKPDGKPKKVLKLEILT